MAVYPPNSHSKDNAASPTQVWCFFQEEYYNSVLLQNQVPRARPEGLGSPRELASRLPGPVTRWGLGRHTDGSRNEPFFSKTTALQTQALSAKVTAQQLVFYALYTGAYGGMSPYNRNGTNLNHFK